MAYSAYCDYKLANESRSLYCASRFFSGSPMLLPCAAYPQARGYMIDHVHLYVCV